MQTNKKEVKKAATASKAKSKAKAKAKAKADDTPKDVRPYDILCGRSKTCFNNIGNRRFRITVGMNVKKYDALPNRTERGKFIVELTRTLREDVGYRFFRLSKKTGKVELSDDEIRAKVGHALRDLSITQANAAEAALKSATNSEEPETTTETKPQATQSPEPRVVSPHAPVRRVTNDFETDSKGRFAGLPQCPDIENMDTSDTSEEIPKAIYIAPQQDMLPVSEESPQSPKIPSEISEEGTTCLQPIPIDDSSSESSVQKEKDVGDDDFCMMPLRFDEPDHGHVLDPIPLEMLPRFINEHLASRSSAFDMDHDIMRDEEESSTEEMCKKIRRMQGFPSFQTQDHDLLSVTNDHHMISSGDSIGCLSLDMAIHA